MKIKPRSFPYPVLSRFSDDVTPNTFTVDLDVTTTSAEYVLDFAVHLDNAGFIEMIDNDAAQLAIHIECQSNFYRRLIERDRLAGTVRIPVGDVTGKVEVTFLVTANSKVEAYQPSGMHDDYNGFQFSIEPSDVLALLETKYFIAEKDPNVLRNVTSIIQVTLQDKGKTEWDIDLDATKILVRMPEKDMQAYHDLRSVADISAILNSTIVIPALVEALHYIKQTDESELEVEREKRWFTVIETKLNSLGITLTDDGSSGFEIAQRIMEHPAPVMLEQLGQLLDIGE